jgi:hypothetical protein
LDNLWRPDYPYSKGLTLNPVTGRDGADYFAVCTFALSNLDPSTGGKTGDHIVDFGFALGRDDGEHVYDIGHTFNKEMWQGRYGEEASNQLNGACTRIQAKSWKNRKIEHPQLLATQNFVWGSCAHTCAATLGRSGVKTSALLGPQNSHVQRLIHDAYAMGASHEEADSIAAEAIKARDAVSIEEVRRSGTHDFDEPEGYDEDALIASSATLGASDATEETLYATSPSSSRRNEYLVPFSILGVFAAVALFVERRRVRFENRSDPTERVGLMGARGDARYI